MSISEFVWTNRARPVIELGIGDVRNSTSGGVWNIGRWDTGRWAGTEPSWYDISCDTRSVRVEYGRRSTTDRFVPGVAHINVDNTTGWADPEIVDPVGSLSVRPGRPVRIGIIHDVYGYRPLFRGFVDAMVPVYSPTENDTVEFSCVDALGEVNRTKFVPLTIPVGANETASARVNRILDAIPWVPRDIRSSSEALIATDLGGQVADLLGQAADSAGGSVFGDLAARVAFRARDWQAFASGSPVDATIGNVDRGGVNRVTFGDLNYLEDGEQVVYGPTVVGDVCPVRWERPFNRADITTRAIIGRGYPPGGDPATAHVVTVNDVEGIAKYGIEPFERTDLLTASNASLLAFANRVLETRGDGTTPRVRSVTLDAKTSDDALDLMSTVEVYKPSRYRCRLQYPPPRGLVFDDEYFATGVVHEMTPNGWTLALNLDVAAPYADVVADAGVEDEPVEWDELAGLLAEARELLEALS
jgi:hypothetical protein